MKKATSKTRQKTNAVIANRRAGYDYELGQKWSAGIVLSGAETKSIRMGRAHLRGAFIQPKDGELWLMNATIVPTAGTARDLPESQQTRARKLLIKKRELETIMRCRQQGYSLVPLLFTTGTRYIKVQFALGKGKKHYDKRETIKKRDTEREQRRKLSAL